MSSLRPASGYSSESEPSSEGGVGGVTVAPLAFTVVLEGAGGEERLLGAELIVESSAAGDLGLEEANAVY